MLEWREALTPARSGGLTTAWEREEALALARSGGLATAKEEREKALTPTRSGDR